MTALAKNQPVLEARWKYKKWTLTAGQIAYQGSAILYNPATQKCIVATGTAVDGYIFIGTSVEKVDASSAGPNGSVDTPFNVDMIEELSLTWFANGTSTDAVAASDIGVHDCYFLDDQTVSILSTGKVLAGRVWAVDTIKGVLVQKGIRSGTLPALPATATYTANDWAPASLVNGAIYDVPTTGAASTITLPAAAPDGTVSYFSADGTKNANTVQYRDATGPVNLTTALTASKRHLVVATKRGGLWFANAYVSP